MSLSFIIFLWHFLCCHFLKEICKIYETFVANAVYAKALISPEALKSCVMTQTSIAVISFYAFFFLSFFLPIYCILISILFYFSRSPVSFVKHLREAYFSLSF